MEHWFMAYAKWPPVNQLIFSCIALMVLFMLLVLGGVWLLQVMKLIAVYFRGWPQAQPAPQPQRTGPPEPACPGHLAEARRYAEEQRMEMEFQARLQAAMELENGKKACTEGPARGHNNKGDGEASQA